MIDNAYRYFKKGEKTPYTGVLTAYYDDGTMQSWQEYEDGLGHGKWINYYPNGKMEELGTYDKNKVEGPIIKFHEDGSPKSMGKYHEWRVRVGEWIYFQKDGTISHREDYGNNGDFRDVEYYYKEGFITKTRYDEIVKSNSN